jgi:hypothetical protein
MSVNEQPKKIPMLISFSGGRTSGYMDKWVIDNCSDKYDFTFVYANTGLEHEETLKFIDNCDKYFNLNLIWIEAVFNQEGRGGNSYKVVSFETAARNGEPFKEAVRKYGLPNKNAPTCTRDLKIIPIEQLMKDKNIFYRAIGIRNDEFSRVTKEIKKKNPTWTLQQIIDYKYNELGFYYPLILDRPTTKDEIRYWWSKMPFNLEITEEYGNCITCWKKSDRKLLTIAKNTPKYFEFAVNLEKDFGGFVPETQNRDYRNVMFREYKSAEDILALAEIGDFEEFKEKKTFNLSLFSDPLDLELACNECGTVC